MNWRRRWPLVAIAVVAVLVLTTIVYQRVSEERRLEQVYAAAAHSVEIQDWPAAVAGFDDVVHTRSNYRDASAQLATAQRELDRQRRYQSAMDRYRAAAWADAVDQLNALLADAPGYRDAAARLADAQRELSFQRELEAAQAQIATKDFEHALPLLDEVARSDSAAAATARTSLARAHLDYAQDLLDRAEASDRQHRWAEVERLVRLAQRQDPEAAGADRMLGHALSKMNRSAEARAALASAVARNPKDADAFNFLGWAELNSLDGDLNRADAAFQKALALQPELANAITGMGDIQADRGNDSAAASSFQRALALDPDEAAAYQGLGYLALQSDAAAAEQHFRHATQLEPDEVIFHLDLASALRRQQKFAAARAEIDRARDLRPDENRIDLELARLYRAQQNWDAALAAYDVAIAHEPANPTYHVERGDVLLDLDEYADALAEGARAVDLGDASGGHLVRAYAFAYLRQFVDARNEARTALDADPDNQLAQQLLAELS